MTPQWLYLLSLSLGVMAVPIDRNPGQQEGPPPKEEVPDENAVGGSQLHTMAVYHSTHICGLTYVMNDQSLLFV